MVTTQAINGSHPLARSTKWEEGELERIKVSLPFWERDSSPPGIPEKGVAGFLKGGRAE